MNNFRSGLATPPPRPRLCAQPALLLLPLSLSLFMLPTALLHFFVAPTGNCVDTHTRTTKTTFIDNVQLGLAVILYAWSVALTPPPPSFSLSQSGNAARTAASCPIMWHVPLFTVIWIQAAVATAENVDSDAAASSNFPLSLCCPFPPHPLSVFPCWLRFTKIAFFSLFPALAPSLPAPLHVDNIAQSRRFSIVQTETKKQSRQI